MRKWSAAVGVGVLALLTACGDSATSQEKLADKLVESANSDDDVDLDEDCLRGLAAKFTDEDAKQLLDNIDNIAATEVSPEGEDLMFQMFDCAKITDLDISSVDVATLDDSAIEQIIDDFVANAPGNVDKDCFRAILADADPGQLASGSAPELFSGITACLNG